MATEPVRVYEEDKDRLREIADAQGRDIKHVVADLLRDPDFECPECGEAFEASDIDPESVREHGVMGTHLDQLVRGNRTIKDFECPHCTARVTPEDVEAVDSDHWSGVTKDELGVTDGVQEPEPVTDDS